MNNDAPSEVNRAETAKPPIRIPNPMSNRRINQRRPQHNENQQRTELYSLRARPNNQRWRDCRELELKRKKQQFRHRWRQQIVYISNKQVVEPNQIKVTDNSTRAWTKHQAITPQSPNYANHCKYDETLYECGNEVFLPNQTRV